MHKAIDKFVLLIIGALYIYALSSGILTKTALEIASGQLMLLSCFIMITLFIIFFNRYTAGLSAVLLLLFGLYMLAAWKFAGSNSGWLSDIYETLSNTVLFAGGYIPYAEVYSLIVIVAIVTVLGIFICINLNVMFNFYLLAVPGVVIFGFIPAEDYARIEMSFLIFLFCFFVLFMKKLNLYVLGGKRGKKAGKKKAANSTSALGMLPAAFILLLLANALPKPEPNMQSPNMGTFFQNHFATVDEFFYGIFHTKYFSFNFTGFSGENNLLGGRALLNNRDVMYVTSEESVYLSGAVKHIYTGTAWVNDEEEDQIETLQSADASDEKTFIFHDGDELMNYPLFSNLQNLPDRRLNENDSRVSVFMAKDGQNVQELELDVSSFAWEDMDGEYTLSMPSFIKKRTININIAKNRTLTIFKPALTTKMEFSDSTILKQKPSGALSVGKLPKNFAWYSISYIYVNYNDEVMKNLLRLSNGASNPIPGQPYMRLRIADVEVGNLSYSKYLNIPETVPSRVYDLALELTNGCDNDYDKMQALVKYISSFPYTLEPEKVPLDRDFVDYFLFDGKEGYCTYYASALAVMARCIGIPTRYMEGYVMPPERNENNSFTVTNYQAHAWVEAYFQDIGWVPFESTAPYSYRFYNETPPTPEQVFSSSMYNTDMYDDYMDEMEYGFQTVKPKSEPVEKPVSPFQQAKRIVLVLLAAIALFGIFLGFRVLQFKWTIRKIKYKSNNDAAIWYFKSILKITAVYGYLIQRNETAIHYAERIHERFAFANGKIFMIDLAKVFSCASYSQEMVSDEERKMMECAYFEMLKFLKRYRMRTPVYIFMKYVLNRF